MYGSESGFRRDDDACVFENDFCEFAEEREASSMEVGMF
jgi:hypothetical protein